MQESLVLEQKGLRSAETGAVADYLELTKPRIALLVVLTAAAGFYLGSRDGVRLLTLGYMIVSISFLSAGISTLNQYMERRLDGLMRRTSGRPLPAGRLSPSRALIFGTGLSVAGLILIWATLGLLCAGLGLATLASYLFAYTPLKTRSSMSTVIGAFPGAMPPLIGWAAARGRIGIEAWILFGIMFLWQFPHFLAIAWMYRDDYAAAGIKMLPVIEPDCRVTGQQILIYTLMLIPVSLLPVLVHMSGMIYTVGALVLGIGFMYFSVRAAFVRTKWQARRLFQASILYLPVLFALMVLNR